MAQVDATVRTEREAKLRPSPEFELSMLAGVVPEAVVEQLPALELQATYYDVHDLALARWGITLRHRTGEGDPRWTLKLPSGPRVDGDGVLERREMDVREAPGHPPRRITDILTALLRGRRLVPVATISALRHRALILGADATPLVEVAHDVVTAAHGRRPLGSWEEIEVEELDPTDGGRAQRATVRALRAAGCTKAEVVPKLVRALGDPARAEPELVVPDLPRHPRPHHALDRALARSVHQILDHDPRLRMGGDPEDLHQLRVAVRRLRSDLRTFRGFVDPALGERVVRELRWLADETNELRDRDVLRSWLEGHRDALPEADLAGWSLLVARCAQEQEVLTERLRTVLDAPRYLDLVHDLLVLVERRPTVSKAEDDAARRKLERRVQRRWGQLEGLVAELESDGGDAALHQARIATKRCRAAVEAVAPLAGDEVAKLAKALAKLQDALGAAHDAAVFEAWLRASDGSPASFAAGELTHVARAEAALLAERWPAVWAKVRRRKAHT